MAKAGRKYRLIIYEYMLNRWWPVTLLVAFFVFLNVGVLWGTEWYFINPENNPLPVLSGSGGTVMLAVGVICLLFSVFLLITRKMAYVQLFDDHMQMVTPFLRMNVSYKRILRSVSAQMYVLFPPKALSSWKRDLIEPVWGKTVVVVHLSGYPVSRALLKFFLSPFFFSDNSPHFVLFVDDWMQFSTDLDSRRSLARNSHRQPPQSGGNSGLLEILRRK